MRPVTNSTMAPKCSSERESYVPLTFNQKLEMTELREEGTWIAKSGSKQASCTSGQDADAKEELSKEIKSATPVHTRMMRKGN